MIGQGRTLVLILGVLSSEDRRYGCKRKPRKVMLQGQLIIYILDCPVQP